MLVLWRDKTATAIGKVATRLRALSPLLDNALPTAL